jgi:hypothetical protein
MNSDAGKGHSRNDYEQQAKIVNGARPFFHAKVSFQRTYLPKTTWDKTNGERAEYSTND